MVKKGVVIGVIFVFLLAGIPSFVHTACSTKGSLHDGDFLYVGGSGLGNYTRIQHAIDNASDGDTIFVFDDLSPYHENLLVNKVVNLIGENKTMTIIDGVLGGDVVDIVADNVMIYNFTIQYHCSYASADIHLKSNNAIISENILDTSNWFGIKLSKASNATIQGNCISKKYAGIALVDSSNNNHITQNILHENTYGLTMNDSYSNSVYYNNFLNNSLHAYDTAQNTWNKNYPSAGNYWDTYSGPDVLWGTNQTLNGSDGVGDVPFSIDGGDNQDNYPLMEPFAMTQLMFRASSNMFGAHGDIINVGDATAFNVVCNIEVFGGFVFLGKKTTSYVPKPLLPGEQGYVKSGLMLGFGKIRLSIALWADNAPYIATNCTGTLILFFLLLHVGALRK